MPKARLSNDKGLVQSSGNGLQITAKNSSTAGLHFKTIEVDLGKAGGTTAAGDNTFIGYTGITLPAKSLIVGCTAIVTEKSNNADMDADIAVLAATDKVAGNTGLSETEVITGIALGDSAGVVNKAFGGFLTTGVFIDDKTSVALVMGAGSQTAGAMTQGKVVVNIAYAGVES